MDEIQDCPVVVDCPPDDDKIAQPVQMDEQLPKDSQQESKPHWLKDWFTICNGVSPVQALAEIASAADKPRDDRTRCASKTLGPNCKVTEGEARKSFAAAGLIEVEIQDCMLLVTKLGLELMASGVDTLDTCKLVRHAAENLLDLVHFHVSFDKPSQMAIGFCMGSLYRLDCGFGLAPAKGPPICAIASAAAHGELSAGSVSAALALLDKIQEQRPPYGKGVHLLAEWLCVALLPVAIFNGNWQDCVRVMILNTGGMALQELRRFQFCDHIMPHLLCVYAGASVSILHEHHLFYTTGDYCHSLAVMMSLIFNLLPGAAFLYGAIEITNGRSNLGTSRILACIMQIFFLAFGLMLGWQVQGYDGRSELNGKSVAGTGAASIPPFTGCTSDYDWTTVYGIIGLPYLTLFMIYLSVAPRDLPLQVVGLYGVWVLYGYLYNELSALPPTIINIIVMFVSILWAGVAEMAGSMPAGVFRVCLLQSLAPSYTAIKVILSTQAIATTHYAGISIVDTVVSIGAALAFGDVVACRLWRDVMKMQQNSYLRKLNRAGIGSKAWTLRQTVSNIKNQASSIRTFGQTVSTEQASSMHQASSVDE